MTKIIIHSGTPYIENKDYPYPENAEYVCESQGSVVCQKLCEERIQALQSFLDHAIEFDREEDRENIIWKLREYTTKQWSSNVTEIMEDLKKNLKDGTSIEMPYEVVWQRNVGKKGGKDKWIDFQSTEFETEFRLRTSDIYFYRQVARLSGEQKPIIVPTDHFINQGLKESGEQKEEVCIHNYPHDFDSDGRKRCLKCGQVAVEEPASEDGKEEPMENNNPPMSLRDQVDYWMDKYFTMQEEYEKRLCNKELTKQQRGRFLHFLETNFTTAPDNIYKTFDDAFPIPEASHPAPDTQPDTIEIRSNKIKLLEAYSLFLEDRGYLDTDWRVEPPYAIDEFLQRRATKQ